jgi:hypothetical protein
MQDEPGDAIGWRDGCIPPCHWSAAPPDRPQHVQVSCSAQNLHDGSTLKICCTGAFREGLVKHFSFLAVMNSIGYVDSFVRIIHCYRQCCGFESICFRAFRIPHYFVRIRILFYHSGKKVRKILISTILWFLFAFLSLKTDVIVPLKSNRQKHLGKKTCFLLTSYQPLMEKKGSGAVAESGSVLKCRGSVPKFTDSQHWLQVRVFVSSWTE